MKYNPGKRKLAPLLLFALFILSAPALFAAEDKLPVAHRVLSNGLEVFVETNRAVPLATVCVVFRGGASAHSPETAGLFHLYEHMMFDGNEKYTNQAAFTAALNRLGVSNWNGATGDEYINYYITVPSDRLSEGIEFWSWAIERPVFDPEKLEKEKSVVINEIRGYHTDPNHIASNALESRLYRDFPWRKNIDGPEANIEGATPAQLEAIRAAYYIPKNTALMIGGDVDPEAAFALAQKWFGDWEGADKPIIGEPPHGPFPHDLKLVYSDDNFYDGVASVQYRWRGPDVLRQTKDTYTSDVLLFLLSSPVGRFKTTLMENGPGLYDPEYISFNYPTARDGGAYSFSTYMLLQNPAADGPALDRVEALRALVTEEFKTIAADPAAYFGEEELAKAKTKLIDQNLLSMEKAGSFVTGTLSFWWSVATTDYFFGYEENCSKVSFVDISGLIGRYLAEAPVASMLRLNSKAFAADGAMKEREAALGYSEVDPEAAFWWQK